MGNNKKVDRYQRIVILVVLMIVAIPAIILSIVDFSPHKLIIQDDIAKVGVKSFKVKDIKNVELLKDIDINRRIKGTRTLTYLRGLYSIEGENQDASVYIYRNKSPYIRIELEDGLLIYNIVDIQFLYITNNIYEIR
ncbi:hypothetical protein [uncultured Clostridium sp.]|uniref:hypothetical protein n=1 Tax=uncultured Clostridium sp. TaxID=59620 RepID=UPI0026193639|nr:hypothetical protein [uncultured Clostridium sp.]